MHSFTINSCSPHRRLPHWWLLLGLMTFLGPWSDFSKAPSRTPTDFLKHWKHRDCWRSKHLAAHCYSPTWFASFYFSSPQRWLQHFSCSSLSAAKICKRLNYVIWRCTAAVISSGQETWRHTCSSACTRDILKPLCAEFKWFFFLMNNELDRKPR